MAEKKKDAKLPETPEQFYEKAAKLQSIDGLIRQGSFRAENYQRAAELFAKAGDYSDAKKRAEECRRLSAEADQNYKETMYSSAVQKMASKDNMVELESAQKMFREISGYLDSAKREEECAKALEHLELKAAKRRRIITIAAGILIIGVLVFFNSPVWRNIRAGILGEEILTEEESRDMALKNAEPGQVVSFGPFTWYVLKDIKTGCT